DAVLRGGRSLDGGAILSDHRDLAPADVPRVVLVPKRDQASRGSGAGEQPFEPQDRKPALPVTELHGCRTNRQVDRLPVDREREVREQPRRFGGGPPRAL